MHSLAEVVALYHAGHSCRAIGGMFGRSHQWAYRRLKAADVKRRPSGGIGPEHKQWKGGRNYAGQGYYVVWVADDDPMAVMRNRQGYVREHRLVMARALGRPLFPEETVHHIDGDKGNNDPRNLQLRWGKHGKGLVLACLDCGSYNVAPVPLAEQCSLNTEGTIQ